MIASATATAIGFMILWPALLLGYALTCSISDRSTGRNSAKWKRTPPGMRGSHDGHR